MRGNRSLRDSQPPSPSGSEDDEARSPAGDVGLGLESPPLGRGRTSKGASNTEDDEDEEEEEETMDVTH